MVENGQKLTAETILPEAQARAVRTTQGAEVVDGVRQLINGTLFTLREWIANGHTTRRICEETLGS